MDFSSLTFSPRLKVIALMIVMVIVPAVGFVAFLARTLANVHVIESGLAYRSGQL